MIYDLWFIYRLTILNRYMYWISIYSMLVSLNKEIEINRSIDKEQSDFMLICIVVQFVEEKRSFFYFVIACIVAILCSSEAKVQRM